MNPYKAPGEVGDESPEDPFCRAAELSDIVAALRSEECRAVYLQSDSGLGASTILRKVAALARESGPVLNLHGATSLARIPFGVLLAYLGAVKAPAGQARVAITRAVLAEFTRSSLLPAGPDAGFGGLPLIIVDDGHSLDEGTAGILSQLAATGTAKLLISCSRRHKLPEPLPKLWLMGVAETITVLPLRQEAGHAFCEALLGGPVLPATSWQYWSKAAGNPLFMRLLVRDAARHGSLVKQDGSWVSERISPVHSPDLREAVKTELRGLSQAGQEALNLLALAEPLEESVFEKMVSAAAIKELRDWPLIHYPPHDPPLLALANPIHGDVIREIVPAVYSRMLHDQLVNYVADGFQSKESLLRRVLWALETGVEIPDKTILRAAVFACKIFQSTTALELAERIHDRKYASRAAMVKARAKYNLGRYREALLQMGPPVSTVDNLDDLLFGSLLRASTRSALGLSVASVIADARELRAAGEKLAKDSGDAANEILAHTSNAAGLVQLMALSRAGRYSEMAAIIASLTQQENLDTGWFRLSQAMALSMESERLTAQGFPLQGFDRAAEAYAIEHAEEDDVFFLPESIMQRQLAATLCSGDWAAAAGILEQFSVDAGPIALSFGGGSNVVRGMVLLRAGRLTDALDALQTGVATLRSNDPQQLLGFCTAMASYAAAQLGRIELAMDLLAGYVESTGMFVVVAHERAYLSAARHVLFLGAAGFDALRAQADEARAEGSSMLELNALVLLLELGCTTVAGRISVLAPTVEGVWARCLGAYAEALEGNDGSALLQAAETLEKSGLFGFAKQALDASARMLHSAGPAAEASQAREKLRRVSRELAVESPSSRRHQETVALTVREQEVSRLAVDGSTDRHIAEVLGVSMRTVEGHLYRAYTKLGISGRDELGAALAEFGDHAAN